MKAFRPLRRRTRCSRAAQRWWSARWGASPTSASVASTARKTSLVRPRPLPLQYSQCAHPTGRARILCTGSPPSHTHVSRSFPALQASCCAMPKGAPHEAARASSLSHGPQMSCIVSNSPDGAGLSPFCLHDELLAVRSGNCGPVRPALLCHVVVRCRDPPCLDGPMLLRGVPSGPHKHAGPGAVRPMEDWLLVLGDDIEQTVWQKLGSAP